MRAEPADEGSGVKEGFLRYDGAVEHDPRIDMWFDAHVEPCRMMVRSWFERMRRCGADVRELFHDGSPIACVEDAPFAYVNAFRAHANVGFYHGAALADPKGLLEGAGTHMRHVKLRPGSDVDEGALNDLIVASYRDIKRRLRHGK